MSDDAALAPLVRASGVSRCDPLHGATLLWPYSLDIRGGDHIVLTGATGSGKSLLLRSLALLDAPETGTIEYRGMPVTADQVPSYRSQVAYVRQRPAMLEGTVEDNLRLPFSLAIYAGREFDPDAARELCDALRQPAGFPAKLTRDLSGGEAQLVALVRALLLDPVVLLLDEPTAALDNAATAAVEALLLKWLGAGDRDKALMMVTHSPEQAARMGRRRLHIAAGKLEPETTVSPATHLESP